MDFLHSPEDEKEKVILALLVANKGEIFLLLYRWDTRMPLHRFKPMRCSGQRLPLEDGFPLMLIPCISSLSFLLVTELGLIIYDQVTASQANTTRYSFKASDITNSDDVAQKKQWTQWARPKRHLQYRQMHDDIFLVREDGLIETCLIDFTNRKVKVTTSVTPGRLDICVDSAFCLLAGPAHTGGGDIIIAGGDMTDGGLFQARARRPLERIQTLSNGAPFRDLVLVDAKNKQTSTAAPPAGASEIFACCGLIEGRGSIAQIHHGLEARIGWTVEHPDVASIEQLWTLEVRSQDSLLLLSTHHSHTSMFTLGLYEMDLEFADSITHPGLDFEQSTLAAAMLMQDLLVQVTPNSVNLCPMLAPAQASRLDVHHLQPLCADVLVAMNFLTIAHRTAEGYGLSMCRISQSSDGLYETLGLQRVAKLQSRPLCVGNAKLSNTTVILVGTEQGEIYVFAVDPEAGITLLLRVNVRDLVPGVEGIAVSSTCLLSRGSSKKGVLLCGLRSGYLICVQVTADQGCGELHLVPKLAGAYSLGYTTTSVSPDDYSSTSGTCMSAFALCRSVLKRVTLSELVNEGNFEVADVCITTRNDTSRPQPICRVIHRVQRLHSLTGMEASGLLVGVTATDLLFSSLNFQRQAVMRHFPVPGIPKRIVYSKYLKQLVVGIDGSTSSKDNTRSNNSHVPHLYFTTANPSDPESSESGRALKVIVGDPGEQIKTMVEYSPTDGSKHYEMIAIALERETKEPNGVAKYTSKVVCLSLKHIMKGNDAGAKARPVMTFPGKRVAALCPLGKSSLLIGAGNEIISHSLDVETKKWTTRSRHPLPSQAASIHTQGSFVFVACTRHSLLILHEDGGKLKFYASDSGAKVTNNVLAFGRYKAVVTSISDKGTDLICFAEDRLSNGYKQLFAANVPLIVERLRPGATGLPSSPERVSFIGNTSDGTLYQFVTIKPDEWALLHFLQGLWLREKDIPPSVPLTVSRPRSDDLDFRPPVPSAVQMHINGDILAGMLEPGNTSLYDLLEARVKLENEVGVKGDMRANLQKLRELAEPLLGVSDDTIGAVSAWLRKLLQWPIF